LDRQCDLRNVSRSAIIEAAQLQRSDGIHIGSLLDQAGGANAIARQLGVDESTVEKGAGALVPHVANGVDTQGLPPADGGVAEPAEGGGLGGMLGGLLGGNLGGGVGNQILGHIFGSKDTSRDVATQASQESGFDRSVLKKLLPIVAGPVAIYLHEASTPR
jgi:hypothetical protein